MIPVFEVRGIFPAMGLAQTQTIYCDSADEVTAEVEQLTDEGYRIRDFSELSVRLTYHSWGKPGPHVLWAVFTVGIGNILYALMSYAATTREVWVRVGSQP